MDGSAAFLTQLTVTDATGPCPTALPPNTVYVFAPAAAWVSLHAGEDVEHAVVRTQRESAEQFPGPCIQPVAHHHVDQAAMARIAPRVRIATGRAGFARVSIARHRRAPAQQLHQLRAHGVSPRAAAAVARDTRRA